MSDEKEGTDDNMFRNKNIMQMIREEFENSAMDVLPDNSVDTSIEKD